jgi:hypothetical protein
LEAVLTLDNSGRVLRGQAGSCIASEGQTAAKLLEGWRNQQLCR